MLAASATAVWLVLSASSSAPPVVYWVSSPTLANETLLVAGAGLSNVTVSLCTGTSTDEGGHVHSAGQPQTCAPVSAAVWEQSVQVVLPQGLAPPASLRIEEERASGAIVDVPVNTPEVQWATSGVPWRMTNNSIQVTCRRSPTACAHMRRLYLLMIAPKRLAVYMCKRLTITATMCKPCVLQYWLLCCSSCIVL